VLLDAGADVHAYNDYALRHAVKHKHVEVVRELVAHGAELTPQATKLLAEV
jgi:hypothetical protein